MSNYCIICLKNSPLVDVRLTNGRSLHKICLDPPTAPTELIELIQEENVLRQKLVSLKPNYSIWGQIFGDRAEDARLASMTREFQSKIADTALKVRRLSSIQDELQKKISTAACDAFDFWPDYPPDWEERKRRIDRRKCEECKSTGQIWVHHRVPVSLGGNHRRENLVALCEDCHQAKHFHKLSTNKSRTINLTIDRTKASTKRQKLALAASAGVKVRIEYCDKSGSDTTRVIIVNKVFGASQKGDVRKWVQAYCFKRRAKRSFLISRIKYIELLDP
jgi:HNH endonuclease